MKKSHSTAWKQTVGRIVSEQINERTALAQDRAMRWVGLIGLAGLVLLALVFGVSRAHGAALPADVRIAAITILDEARGEGKPGMYAIGCVIQERMTSKGLNPEAVCLKKLQFSGWWTKVTNSTGKKVWQQRSLKNKERWLKSSSAPYAVALAKALVAGQKFDQSFTGRANHFTSDPKNTSWAKGKTPTKIIGGHWFYRL